MLVLIEDLYQYHVFPRTGVVVPHVLPHGWDLLCNSCSHQVVIALHGHWRNHASLSRITAEKPRTCHSCGNMPTLMASRTSSKRNSAEGGLCRRRDYPSNYFFLWVWDSKQLIIKKQQNWPCSQFVNNLKSKIIKRNPNTRYILKFTTAVTTSYARGLAGNSCHHASACKCWCMDKLWIGGPMGWKCWYVLSSSILSL